MAAPSAHYDENYFRWQRESGLFGGSAELIKFTKFVKSTDVVLDFGCGGGFILSNLVCARRIGVEVNPAARAHCREIGIDAVETLDEIRAETIDIVISNHALEHVNDPFTHLQKLRTKLKIGGRMILCVPFERNTAPYRPYDINQHLYTWSPLNAGNLVQAAGFRVTEAKVFAHRFPPFHRQLQRIFGWTAFHLMAQVCSYVSANTKQVRVIAERM